MELERDVEQVPLPGPSLTTALIEEIERLEVGESGCVEAKLATVRTLLSRDRARKVAYSQQHVGTGKLDEQGLPVKLYEKKFIARATTEPGVVRVWRVA